LRGFNVQSISDLTHCVVFLCTLTVGHLLSYSWGHIKENLFCPPLKSDTEPSLTRWSDRSAALPHLLFQSVRPIRDADLWQSGQCPGGPRSSLCNTMRLPVLSLISAPHLMYTTGVSVTTDPTRACW